MAKAAKKARDKAQAEGTPASAEELLFWPSAMNGLAAAAWATPFGEVDPSEIVQALGNKAKAVRDGDMSPVEAMLHGQAAALQVIFTNLSRL